MKKMIDKTIKGIAPLDAAAMEQCGRHWDAIAKPLKSLGRIESILVQIAGIQADSKIKLAKKALVVMCADNGVVTEGVTQTGQEVTAIVAQNFLEEKSCVAIMCKDAKTDLFPVDVGMITDTGVVKKKVAYGTKNMYLEPAMTRAEAIKAIEAGIETADELKGQGYHIIATGEMGIGNTTTSSAVCSVLLGVLPEAVTGRGAGLSSRGLERKIEVIRSAVTKWKPDPGDPVDVLAKVGGFDLAALTGLYLGGAANRMPVVMDGFISAAAALCAVRLCPLVADYIVASHVSREPAAELLLKELEKEPMLHADMCLGEGTGAVMLFPVLDMGLHIYQKMSTFDEIDVATYVPLV